LSAELVAYLVRQLVEEPDAVRVEETEREGALVLRLQVADADRGKVIGRRGRMVKALRTLAQAGGARNDRRVLLEIVE
jgi:predicted RNA-binding protein YlqC (UPF0109 family)